MFDRIRVPTPFQVGSVNCYITGRTLVDPGPDSEDGWDELVESLAQQGLEPIDIDQVLVTHPHPDHFGMAKRFSDRGADIVASEETADIIEDFPGRLAYEQEFFIPFLVRHGIQEDVANTVVELPEAYLEFAPSCDVDRTVSDGDTITVDGTDVLVESLVGHAPGELLFAWEQDGGEHAIVGDHVLQRITPNPFLQPPPEPGESRPRVLPGYNRSLERLATRDFAKLYPGHGDFVDKPTRRIEQLLEFHERRTGNVYHALDGKTTAAAVMRTLFGDIPVTEIYGGISESIGHLDVLELRGEVDRSMEDGVYRYWQVD